MRSGIPEQCSAPAWLVVTPWENRMSKKAERAHADSITRSYLKR